MQHVTIFLFALAALYCEAKYFETRCDLVEELRKQKFPEDKMRDCKYYFEFYFFYLNFWYWINLRFSNLCIEIIIGDYNKQVLYRNQTLWLNNTQKCFTTFAFHSNMFNQNWDKIKYLLVSVHTKLLDHWVFVIKLLNWCNNCLKEYSYKQRYYISITIEIYSTIDKQIGLITLEFIILLVWIAKQCWYLCFFAGVCLIEKQSDRKTHKIGSVSKDGSKDFGLFQINEKYWCSNTGIPGRDCNVTCVGEYRI